MTVTVQCVPTVAEAAETVARDRSARYFGGGTLLMRAVNEGADDLGMLVRTTDPDLKRITASGATITLGAGVTMRAVLADPALDFLHPVARTIGGPALQAQATVGGNLFAPHPYGDVAAALLALDAEAACAGGPSRPLADLLRDTGSAGSPVVRSVSFTRPEAGTFRFRKVTRVRPTGAPVLALAASIPMVAGRISGARIAWSAMAPRPLRAAEAERALEGCRLDAAGIAGALAAATHGLNPPDDALASGWYRSEVAPVHLRRLLLGDGED